MAIKKKGNKNWEYCVYIGLDEHGNKKYKRKSGFATKKECILASELIGGSSLNGKTFANIGNLFFNYKKSQGLKITTINHYESLYHCIQREFKKYASPIKSIKKEDIIEFILNSNKLRKQNSTRKLVFIIKSIFVFAHKNGYITRNIFDTIDPIKEIKSTHKIWNIHEIQQYLPTLRTFKFYDIIFLAMETGMRLGEILGLTWDCIDLYKGIIYIDKSYVRSNGYCYFSTPKTKASIRQIVLFDRSIKLLSKLHKTRRSKYVFYDSNNIGKPLNPHTVTTSFRKFLDNNNIRHLRFHDLRHLHATLLLHNNVNYKLLAKRLGHTNIAFTLETYTHILPDNEIQLFKSLPNLF